MKFRLTPAWARAFAGLFINLSAAWFATIFIAPSFHIPLPTLTLNTTYGIVYLVLSVECEKLL